MGSPCASVPVTALRRRPPSITFFVSMPSMSFASSTLALHLLTWSADDRRFKPASERIVSSAAIRPSAALCFMNTCWYVRPASLHTSLRSATTPVMGLAAGLGAAVFFFFDAVLLFLASLFRFFVFRSESESSPENESDPSKSSKLSSSSSSSASFSSSSLATAGLAGFGTVNGLAALTPGDLLGAWFSLDLTESSKSPPDANTLSTYFPTASFASVSSRSFTSKPRSSSSNRRACFMVNVARFARKNEPRE
mmetsp:Transcript_10593/g.39243  ORF Transcript_10593/g.39243 Transcript_10593/m.39243 type:complete len:252 (+) Transcript_10593:386-1141(+)